jgi:hypothetical protein
MAESCQQQLERIEENVLQPIDQWVQRQEQRCKDEPCIWWMLCLNKLFCWLVVVLVKITLWVMTVVVRWVYRPICVIVSVVVGLFALLAGDASILLQAIKDLWEVVKGAIYSLVGVVIFAALRIVDVIQSAVRIQPAKRPLTEKERGVLWPIFRDSLNYGAIELVVGSSGILTTSGRPFTMGYTIYLPTYSDQDLVHESTHVWQFQFRGFQYIGNSALNQLDSIAFNKSYDPYNWKPRIDAGDSWYTLKSVEAQAKFIEDVWALGGFDFANADATDVVGSGAFFREDDELGHNFFKDGGDYTEQANDAWRIVRTG